MVTRGKFPWLQPAVPAWSVCRVHDNRPTGLVKIALQNQWSAATAGAIPRGHCIVWWAVGGIAMAGGILVVDRHGSICGMQRIFALLDIAGATRICKRGHGYVKGAANMGPRGKHGAAANMGRQTWGHPSLSLDELVYSCTLTALTWFSFKGWQNGSAKS